MADHFTKQQQQPAKFYSHFLYKALIVSVFMFILPLLPTPQSAPDFIGTGGWEFLHLVFVGIAVSYGLFSRRRDDGDDQNSDRKDSSAANGNLNNFDAAHCYVSKFLPVASVFDDDDDGGGEGVGVTTKVETWTSQYLRNEPMVVVAADDEEDGDGGGENRRFVRMEKPLLLPIRSLKSTGSDSDSRSEEADSVLRSPIPWRSRSGRFQADRSAANPVTTPSPPPPPPPPPPSVASSSRSIRPPRNPRKSSASPIPQFSSDEIQAKNAEDLVRRKTIFRSPPPPPPPPPPRSVRSSSRRPPPPPSADHDHLPPVNRSNDLEGISERSLINVEFPAMEDDRVEKVVVMEEDDDDDSSSSEAEYEEVKDKVLEFPLPDEGDGYDEGGCSPPPPPDVDRKADEFIAKFREQIRLQRMESIKRTAEQVRKNRSKIKN